MIANPPLSDRGRQDTVQRILKGARAVIRHTAVAIGWASHVWFNLTLPLAILLAGIAVTAGLILMVGIAPDHVDTIRGFGEWLTAEDQ